MEENMVPLEKNRTQERGLQLLSSSASIAITDFSFILCKRDPRILPYTSGQFRIPHDISAYFSILRPMITFPDISLHFGYKKIFSSKGTVYFT